MALFVNHVGINLTANKLQLVEIDFKNGRFLVENIDEEPFHFMLNTSVDENNFINLIQNSFDKIISRRTIKTDIVSFTLPDSFFYSSQVPSDSNLNTEDLKKQIKWEFSKLFPFENTDEFVFDKFISKQNSNKSSNLIFFALKKVWVNGLHKFCVRNNLVMKYIDNTHIASNHIVQLLSGNKNNDFVSINLTRENYSLIYSVDNIPQIFMNVKVNNAEIVVEKIYESLQELNKLISSTGKINEIILFSDEIYPEVIEQLENGLKKKIKLLNPFNKIEVSSQLKSNRFFTELSYLFCSPSAIAMRLT